MNARLKSHSGFTLVELMVVMAIIAILATAGLSAYTGYINKAILLWGRVFSTKLEQSFFESAFLRLDFEGNTNDSSSHNYPILGSGTYETGANGQGINLLWNTLTVNNTSVFNSPTFTFAVWVKPNVLKGDGYAWSNALFQCEDYWEGPLSGGSWFRFGITSSWDVHFWTHQSWWSIQLNWDKIIRTGQWNHLAVTYDGTQATLYVNGQLDKSFTWIYNAPSGEYLYINPFFYLTAADIVYDDIRFYSSSFLAGDIEKMYRNGTSKYLALR